MGQYCDLLLPAQFAIIIYSTGGNFVTLEAEAVVTHFRLTLLQTHDVVAVYYSCAYAAAVASFRAS
jgi:hypothetical protein